MLFAAGKPIKSLHRVASGVLARSIALPKGRRQIVDFLFTGDICNLVQSDGTHMFDCEAITDATTCAVDASVLRKFTGASVAIGKALEEEVLRALNRTAEQLVTVGKFSAAERLLRFLHLLEEAYAERGLPTRPLALPMTRSDIGDYLGMQLETVCRAFAKLKARDLVGSVSAEHVVLHRRKAASLAHGKTPAVSALV
jgi:CRP/FNR family transcriptional regulator